MDDIPDLTDRQLEIISLLPNSKDGLAERLRVKSTTIGGHIARIRQKGVDVRYDRDTNKWYLEDERAPKLRRVSTKHKQTKTRQANALVEAEETVLLKRLRQTDPLEINQPLKRGNETFLSVIGDLHFGDVVETDRGEVVYNMQIARQSVERFAEKCLEISEIEGSYTGFDGCVLVLTGDIATGTHIYDGQVHDIEAFLADQVTEATQALIDLVITLASEFETVQVYGVLGNHGLDRAGANRGSNTDLLVYRWLEDGLRRSDIENVGIEVAESTHHLNCKVRDWRLHIRHGQDSHRHVDKTSASGNKWRGWRDKHRYDMAIRGHFHCPDLSYVLNKYPVITTPSPKRGGEYIERIGSPDVSDASYLGWCVGVGDSRPLTFKRLVDDL